VNLNQDKKTEALGVAIRDFIVNPTICSKARFSSNKSAALNQIIKLAFVRFFREHNPNPEKVGLPRWVAMNSGISKSGISKAMFDERQSESTLSKCPHSMALVECLVSYIHQSNYVRVGLDGSKSFCLDFKELHQWIVSEIVGACRFSCVTWSMKTIERLLGFDRSTQLKMFKRLGYTGCNEFLSNHEFKLAFTEAFRAQKTRGILKSMREEAMREQSN
jgi:hypothetical protein